MSHIKNITTIVLAATALLVSNLSFASQPLAIDIQGNKVEVLIELPGDISADLTLQFENAVGLTQESLGLSAELIDVTSLNLLDRLPDGLNITPAAAFPMMITIEPKADSGFSFSGVATVDIHTHNLEYTAGTPFRFFKAPLNGEFKDITQTLGSGSLRSRGSTGRFSQFIIVADLRAPLLVVEQKLTDLESALSDFSPDINAAVYSALLQDVNDVKQLILLQKYNKASNKLSAFNRRINDNRGVSIPDVWRSSRDIRNVAGELIAFANTLRFSLRLIK
ncbi:hypothetical protein SAMN05216262_102187 [Colwellia chukchiensis]|uniref:Uncharacterized protein n=1 Tax=Colwellia chukchiensis TaxID=641665 RepID=A0A1H7JAP4_9GAMM|nr:DUF6689 family protein [Colwellia chukchiensis]SEK71761.1 hypothetical protein SAMN05216262_102187 [Colwellia chukchiensis]